MVESRRDRQSHLLIDLYQNMTDFYSILKLPSYWLFYFESCAWELFHIIHRKQSEIDQPSEGFDVNFKWHAVLYFIIMHIINKNYHFCPKNSLKETLVIFFIHQYHRIVIMYSGVGVFEIKVSKYSVFAIFGCVRWLFSFHKRLWVVFIFCIFLLCSIAALLILYICSWVMILDLATGNFTILSTLYCSKRT